MMNKFLKKNEGNKEVNNELKEKYRQTLIRKKQMQFKLLGANETTTTESAPSDEEVSAKIIKFN